jgi:hypothetical protein
MAAKPFVELNRKDGSLILIRRSEILSIVDEPDGALLKLRNGTIQVVQQTYDQVKSEMNIDE